MSLNLETMQTTAVFDANGILHATTPLPGRDGEQVQIVVIRLREEPTDYDDTNLTPAQWARGLSVLMERYFADDPAEDIYSAEDGQPYNASQD